MQVCPWLVATKQGHHPHLGNHLTSTSVFFGVNHCTFGFWDWSRQGKEAGKLCRGIQTTGEEGSVEHRSMGTCPFPAGPWKPGDRKASSPNPPPPNPRPKETPQTPPHPPQAKGKPKANPFEERKPEPQVTCETCTGAPQVPHETTTGNDTPHKLPKSGTSCF